MDLVTHFTQFKFKPSDTFMWSPSSNTIFYLEEEINSDTGKLALLHEISHGLLGHSRFDYDIELLKIEVEAWEQARELSSKYSIKLNEEYIEAAMETYRNWLHKRSLCPECNHTGIQNIDHSYKCINCYCKWTVPGSQICQVRRQKITQAN